MTYRSDDFLLDVEAYRVGRAGAPVPTCGDRWMRPPAPANAYMRYPEWSPRGGGIVFERGELRGNIWMLALSPPP